jgi:hypothetical protein
MAAQTVTTAVNYDSAAISGLLDGEAITINGGALTIDADTGPNQQAAAFGIIALSSTLGGSVLIDGTKVWEVPFASSTGNVPTQVALGSNGVTGGTSGATGELTRVWAAGSFDPAVAGGAMPAAGYIKLRSKTGNFQAGETITLPGGATIVAANAGRRGTIQVVGRTTGTNANTLLVLPRLASCVVNGDWYYFDDLTNGADNQTFTLPVREELGGIQIETEPGSNVYEWYSNAGDTWNGHYYVNELLTATNGTLTRNAISAFPFPAADRFRENAANGVHGAVFTIQSQSQAFPNGVMRFTARLTKDTRRWVAVQFGTNGNADRFGVLVDLDAGTLAAIPNVGSPTGTASSITALGGGIYEVTVTINHTGTAGGSVTIATSDSATPSYVNGLPSFAGNASEGVNIALSRLEMATFLFIPTDARGKFCGVDPIAGTVQLALRGANNSGFKPPSGCKVRIPNVFLSTTVPADSNSPMLAAQNTRYYISASSGPGPTINKAVFNWFNVGNSVISDSCTTQFWGSTSIDNVCLGVGLLPYLSIGLNLASVFSGSITNSRLTRRGNSAVLSATNCANFTIKNCRLEQITRNQGFSQRTAVLGHNVIVSLGMSNFVFEDCEVINGQTTILAGNANGFIKNFKYADVMTGSTPALASTAIALQGANMEINGVSSFGDLANVHPYDQIINLAGYYTNLKISNIGTPAVPYDCGSANATGYIFQGSVGIQATLRRIYTTNLRISPFLLSTTASVIEMFDVWGTGTQFLDLNGQSITVRGGRWTNMRRSNANAVGTHWDDSYNTTTTGRITVMANEPTASSASQLSGTFAAGSGYTGSTIVLSKLTDEAVWTSPHKFYGHTVFGGGGSCGGTDVQNLLWEYKIDTGGGFGGTWTFLANTVRTTGNPADGATTVTMNATDRAALARQPQIGDYIQHSTFRLPQNTTITNIVGEVITVSNPFVSSILGAAGTISFSPVNVAVSPSDGYRLQIRCHPTVAAASTLTTGFSAGIQTNATDQQIPHPLPGSLVNIANLVPQSRVKVTRVDTGALLQQASCGAGTTLAFDFEYSGPVRVEARNASSPPAYKPWQSIVNISANSPTEITALQEPD